MFRQILRRRVARIRAEEAADPHHTRPTQDNQIWQARRLAARDLDALRRHALVCTENACPCVSDPRKGDGFCCAALLVLRELEGAEDRG